MLGLLNTLILNKKGYLKMKNLDVIKKMLENFPKSNRFYWIGALIKQGEISIKEAGYLIINNGLLK
jgi:hypothetical protein